MPTVLFDIDGTLMNSGGAGSRAMARTAHQILGVENIPPIPVHGRTDFAIFGDLLAAFEIEFETCYPVWRRHYHRWLELELGEASPIRPRQLPGASVLLENLKNDNWHSALITGNSQEAAMLKLRAINLEDSFVSGGFGDWSGCRDHLAQETVTVCKSAIPGFCVTKSIMIGDTVHDVQCAKSVNMAVVAVTTGGSSREELESVGASLVVNSLAELNVDLLAEMIS